MLRNIEDITNEYDYAPTITFIGRLDIQILSLMAIACNV